ncbi:ATP-grasp fold amidoligase family protein [uncultured Shewanella sp.]|uniref:ATP-grasp fold amidoligase family protein n=1 Tax=uncultured Shewanella sp. TaxID=173975 RepID=UPI0026162E07|nr:ATP-grasp fold amidoligase family protein [uncultured Shewanella sp.]
MASLQYRLFSKAVGLLPDIIKLNLLYFRRFNAFLNLKSPKTFNEKLQLRKIKDRNKLLSIAADKLKSKEFASSVSSQLYIPKTLYVGDSPSFIDDLDLSKLPSDYVFKANHTSQTIEIIRGSKHLSKNRMKRLAKSWLKHDQSLSLGEWAYQDIPRKIFVEEFLDFEGEAPDDYKFFVYHGKVHFIQLDSDRFTNHSRNMFDYEWNELGFEYSYKRKSPAPEKPLFLNEMIRISEELGAYFDFIRVDLYYYNKMITFGELTVYPGAGFEKFPDKKYDLLFGQPWIQSY